MRLAQIFAVSTALSVTLPASAQSNGPEIYKPASAWAVEYGDDYCRLARSFSSGNKRLTLAMDRIQPGPAVRILIHGDGIRTSRRASSLGFSFTPAREQREARILEAKTADGGSMYNFGTVYLANVAESSTREQQRSLRGRYTRETERAFGGSIDGFLVDRGVFEPVWLETGELGTPLEALQVCTDELVQHWGFDAEKHRNLRRPVAPSDDMGKWLPAGIVSPGDLRLVAGSQNVVRLKVDASGAPTDCAIHFASLPAAVNEKLCASLLQNARFEPARDAANNPIDSYWLTEIGFLAAPRRG